MDMLETVARFFDTQAPLPQGGLVLAAVSGGADSMGLLWALHRLAQRNRLRLGALHFNHQIRGADAQADAAFVEAFCWAHQIPLTIETGDVPAFAKEAGLGLEEAARVLRYRFFQQAAERLGAVYVATAHTADDNVETVLLHLTRGAGLAGLGGIPPVRDNIVRPILTLSRAEVEAFLQTEGIPHVEDGSNQDLHYARNRIRHLVIPVLRDLNPALTQAVGQTTGQLRADEAALRQAARDFLNGCHKTEMGIALPLPDLLRLPPALQARVLRTAALDFGVRLYAVHVRALLSLVAGENPSAALDLPGGLIARRQYDQLLFAHTGPTPQTFSPQPLPLAGMVSLPPCGFTIRTSLCAPGSKIYNSLNTFYIRNDSIVGALTVRPRQPGDTIQLPKRPTKTLKKLFIDAKIPREQRECIPVIADACGVIAVAGFGPNAGRLTATPGPNVLKIQIEEII